MPKTRANHREQLTLASCIMLLVAFATAGATVAVTAATVGGTDPATDGEIALLDDNALEALAAPIALYPDELLAIVLPAATFPLQIVQAARFLEARQGDPGLEPDDAWDDSVVALLNYPEVLALLDSDLAWTARLGDAVIAQEAPLMSAITRFRERAYNAGNLRSDERQQVSRGADVIAINTASTDTVYVPYYNPSAVIVPQATPVVHYYSNPYPLYYYPYVPQHPYLARPFWGLTTAYALGWATHAIRIYRHDHYAHPYFHRHYFAPRYRDRRSSWPRHAPLARHDHRRKDDGYAWRERRIAARHAERRRHSSDRIRSSREAGRTGISNGFRASNGLLGNGALARPHNHTQARELVRADRGLAASGAGVNARRDTAAVRPPAVPRQRDVAKRAVPLQQRAQEYIEQRRKVPSRQAVATRADTATAHPRSPQRGTRRATPTRGDRAAARGSSTRANSRPNAGMGPRRAFRDYGGGSRTRAGGGFLGNGGARQRR